MNIFLLVLGIIMLVSVPVCIYEKSYLFAMSSLVIGIADIIVATGILG